MLSFSEQATIVSGELLSVNEMLQKLRYFSGVPLPGWPQRDGRFEIVHSEFHKDLGEMR